MLFRRTLNRWACATWRMPLYRLQWEGREREKQQHKQKENTHTHTPAASSCHRSSINLKYVFRAGHGCPNEGTVANTTVAATVIRWVQDQDAMTRRVYTCHTHTHTHGHWRLNKASVMTWNLLLVLLLLLCFVLCSSFFFRQKAAWSSAKCLHITGKRRIPSRTLTTPRGARSRQPLARRRWCIAVCGIWATER